MGVLQQPRKHNGRYARKGMKTAAVLGVMFGVIALIVIVNTANKTEYSVIPEVHAEPSFEGKIEDLKADVVERLKQCESREATEDDAVINPHDGGSPSFGLLQFKLATVQHYVKKFEGKDITRYEALQIAMDEERARALAKQVIFEEVGGVFNWENCTRIQNLAPRIEVIRELES